MELKVIRTARDHRMALARLRQLVGTPGRRRARVRDEIEILGMLIERYESTRYPMESVDAVDAIEIEMEQRGLSARELAPYLGPPSRVSEVLNRKRGLSLTQIRKLQAGLGIPLAVLIQTYERAAG